MVNLVDILMGIDMYRKISFGRTMLVMLIVSIIINIVNPLIIQNFIVFSLYGILFCFSLLYVVDFIELLIHNRERKHRDKIIKEKIGRINNGNKNK